TIRVADTTKMFGEPNPPFRISYSGFVLGENSSVFTTQPVVNAAATTNSAPGYYALTPAGVAASNYNITYVDGRLTIYPTSGTNTANLQAFMSNGNNLLVRVFSPAPDLGDIFLYNMSGRLVAKKNIFLPQGFISTTMTVNGIPAGTYIVKVMGKKTNLTLTILIIH
ncbi:MAG: T9SS type A sorting domain-containing protein, partial [Chitinophagaceae bacterium]